MNVKYIYHLGNTLKCSSCSQYNLKLLSVHYRWKSTSSSVSPLEKYNQKISDGKLVNDEHQRDVIAKLNRLYNDLQTYQPPRRNLIWKLVRFKNSASDFPKGLYLYGSVGCGKTMLMDLFFSCCKVCRG